MERYSVFIRGENFLILTNNQMKKMGFYTTRYIEAINREEATNKALDLIRNELIDVVQNDKKNPPFMFVEEIIALENFGDAIVPGSGFTWYQEDS